MTVGGEDHCIQVGMDKAALADFPALLHLPAVEDQYLCNELTLLAESRPNLPPIQQQGYDYRVAAMILRVFELAGVPLPASPATSADRLAEQACAIIRENYRQLPQIGSVAGMLGISPDYLRHVFAARYGMSPKHFLVLTRIARARDLLRHSCLPLKTVADLCGFGNERYLCTSFLATEGISPGAYRKAFAPASRGLGHDADRRRRLPARTTRVAAGTVPAGAGARPGITPAGLWPDPRTPLRRPRKTGRGCRP
jgi:AraC-like DNA-binding protein